MLTWQEATMALQKGYVGLICWHPIQLKQAPILHHHLLQVQLNVIFSPLALEVKPAVAIENFLGFALHGSVVSWNLLCAARIIAIAVLKIIPSVIQKEIFVSWYVCVNAVSCFCCCRFKFSS